MKYRKRIEVEAWTFDEFIKIGVADPHANIVDGVPWSFQFKGLPVTHETDDHYIITSAYQAINFRRGTVLTSDGFRYTVFESSDFYRAYEVVNDADCEKIDKEVNAFMKRTEEEAAKYARGERGLGLGGGNG